MDSLGINRLTDSLDESIVCGLNRRWQFDVEVAALLINCAAAPVGPKLVQNSSVQSEREMTKRRGKGKSIYEFRLSADMAEENTERERGKMRLSRGEGGFDQAVQ